MLQQAEGRGPESANLEEMNVRALLGLLLAAPVISAASPSAPPASVGARSAPAVRLPTGEPSSRAARPRRWELQFPRALEPLRAGGASPRPGIAPAPDRGPGSGGTTPSPAGSGQLRMPAGLTGGSRPDRLPTVAVSHPGRQGGVAGWAARLAQPIAGAGLVAVGLAGAWWAWRRRARSE